jgi:hypothetical protein
MNKFCLVAVIAAFLFTSPETQAGLFCEGFEEGYIEGYEQESKTLKVTSFPDCPIKVRDTLRDDFSRFRLGYLKGVLCGKQHRKPGKKKKCKR